MSTSPVEVSVIIPVHNGEKYLAESIQSILDQKHPALEIVVVDNVSTDATAGIAQGFSGVTYCYLAQKGLVNALNHGVELSRGMLLGFLDSDDLWKPHKLAAQIDAFTRNPEVDMVFGHVAQFISPELEDSVRAKLSIRHKELPGFFRGAMLIRKESLLRAGKFDTATEYADFIDWYMRAQEQGLQELMLPDVLTLRRLHGANMGYVDNSRRVDFVRVLKRGLDRRRRLGKA